MSNYIHAGLRIFDVIEILFENPKTRRDVTKELLKRGIKADWLVISKYIKTLNFAGFEIVYKNKSILIEKSPFTSELNRNESEGFKTVISEIEKIINQTDMDEVKYFERKLFDVFQPDIINFVSDKKNNFLVSKKELLTLVEIIKYMSDDLYELKVRYMGKNRIIIPKEIKFGKNGIFVVGNSKKNKNILTFKLSEIEKIASHKLFSGLIPNGTIFMIKDELVKNYIARIGERVKYTNNKCAYVTNYMEPKEELFNRLIRYGKMCEVIEPEADRDKFQRKVKRLLSHYKSL